jgi:hypothetical protein
MNCLNSETMPVYHPSNLSNFTSRAPVCFVKLPVKFVEFVDLDFLAVKEPELPFEPGIATVMLTAE